MGDSEGAKREKFLIDLKIAAFRFEIWFQSKRIEELDFDEVRRRLAELEKQRDIAIGRTPVD